MFIIFIVVLVPEFLYRSDLTVLDLVLTKQCHDRLKEFVEGRLERGK